MAVNSNSGNSKEKPSSLNFENQSTVLSPVEQQTSQLEQESVETKLEQTIQKKSGPTPAAPKKVFVKKSKAPAAQSVAGMNDPKTLEIKSVLGKGLGSVYYQMDQKHQQEFLAEEEKAAAKIKEVLAEEPVKSRKIFKIIFGWLKMVPVVNKFFLKQEAKIKTDQIVELDKKR